MGRFDENVKQGDIFHRIREAIRHEEIYHGGMRELNDPSAISVDHGHQLGTGCQRCFPSVIPVPTFVQFWERSFAEIICEHCRELLDLKWSGSHGETLK